MIDWKEEKIQKVEQKQKQEFEQRLIADYQSVAKSKKIQKEAQVWDETLNDAWNTDLEARKERI